jgi:hypothetical protein
MTPAALADELGVSPIRIRAWLRRTHPRSAAEKNQRWHLDAALVAAVRSEFAGKA